MLDEKNKFEFVEEQSEVEEVQDLSSVALEDLPKESFELVDNKNYSFDQKFETKPTTFLKDSLKRFSKNKSSVVAAWILGILLIMAFLVPIIDTNDVSTPHSDQVYLEPKLFDSGTGFWDGCKSYSGIAYDEDNECPNPADFNKLAVKEGSLKVDPEPTYTNSYSNLGKGGFVNLSKYIEDETDIVYMRTVAYTSDIAMNRTLVFKMTLKDEEIEYYQRVPYSLSFIYRDDFDIERDVEIVKDNVDYLGNTLGYDGEFVFNVIDAINKDAERISEESVADGGDPYYVGSVSKGYFKISIDTTDAELNSSILIKNLDISTNSAAKTYKEMIAAPSFTDANEMVGRTKTIVVDNATVNNNAYWSCNGNKFIYKAEIRYCSFTYDTYAAAFGKKIITIQGREFKDMRDNKHWFSYTDHDPSSFTILDEEHCPILAVNSEIRQSGTIVTYNYECVVLYYKYKGMSSMPRYLLGTDKAGRDMFKYVFDGLKTSLLLGIITSAICFIFGLCWGAISGYFGGAVDLAMERFTDILGGLPWIVVMTLCIIHLGQNFGTFALALCMTGWIGTASGTRTQFYRFKGREYVLASRTLGAKDMRLIFKHILPNAMGTIITSAVLMIPSVIFSEATISYLGLGLQGMSSLGVILSKNQGELLQHPYLLLFPSVVIALLMISFNLFGNGLRDAINPSLKGEGE